MKNKVLAVAWHPGGANALLPVMRNLKRENVEILAVGRDYARNAFVSAGFSDMAPTRFTERDFDRLIDIHKPNVVLTGTSVQDDTNREVPEQRVVLSAGKVQVPSISVLDFWLGYTERFSDFGTSNLRYLPTAIAVMDLIASDAMMQKGFPTDKLVVTGNPNFDSLVSAKSSFTEDDRIKVRRDLGIPPEKKVTLFASQPIYATFGKKYGYDEKDALWEMLNAASAIKDKEHTLLVKVHPREDKTEIERIVRGRGVSAVVDQVYDTRKALLASDIVISPFSTVLIESSYLGMPSISLQPGLNTEDPLVTNGLGVTFPIYKKGDIMPVLRELVYKEEYREEMAGRAKSRNFATDGRATERVSELVRKFFK